MALEKAFHELSHQLRKLRDTFLGVRLTVVEDKPPRNEVVLVDRFGDAIEDALGWVEEELTASADGEQAVGNAPDMYRARRALTACQEHLNRWRNSSHVSWSPTNVSTSSLGSGAGAEASGAAERTR